MRENEHAEWEASDHDDDAANQLVLQAKDVLAGFYEDNNLVFIQKKKMDPVVAGEAPPPPPTTWEAPYGGKTEEATGIVAILEMIAEDIQKDMAKAKSEEDEDQKAFEEFKKNTEAQIKALEDSNNSLEGEKGDKEDDVAANKKDRLA